MNIEIYFIYFLTLQQIQLETTINMYAIQILYNPNSVTNNLTQN